MSYFGWPKDWFHRQNDTDINEMSIKSFVNRYFDFPEDWDCDDVPLIMIFVKCKFCGNVQQHYVRENRVNFLYNWASVNFYYAEDAENFVYNWDNTFTSFSYGVRCTECNLVWSYKLEQFWNEESFDPEEEYQHSAPQFDSPLEELFWVAWKTRCLVDLSPQYQVGKYRIDFVHLPTKTAIEVDGEHYHSSPDQIAHDKRRQLELEKQGWSFIRFKFRELRSEMDRCIVNTLNFISRKS